MVADAGNPVKPAGVQLWDGPLDGAVVPETSKNMIIHYERRTYKYVNLEDIAYLAPCLTGGLSARYRYCEVSKRFEFVPRYDFNVR